jgi:glutamyl-tRNA synthetase
MIAKPTCSGFQVNRANNSPLHRFGGEGSGVRGSRLPPQLLPRGRLAPSPTGAQHVGNARTYLIAWLSARSRNAELALRIEDIDSPRVKPGATELIFEDLRWLGLDWDGEPIVQSKRLPRYKEAFKKLANAELIYPCTCSRSDVADAASAPHLGTSEPVYPGTCARRTVLDVIALKRQDFAWRFRATDSPSYIDGYRGAISVENGGDFVVWKRGSKSPAYQLAVVVDDADMGITEVIRGDDLIPSTPRQLLLYRALGWSPPQFTHVPLVVGPDGRRLAKRHGDTRLTSLREAGVRAENLIGLLAWSCGWLPRIEPIIAKELIPLFRLAAIPAAPFVLTPELLQRIGYVA